MLRPQASRNAIAYRRSGAGNSHRRRSGGRSSARPSTRGGRSGRMDRAILTGQDLELGIRCLPDDMVSSTFDDRCSGRSRGVQEGIACMHLDVPGPPKPPVPPPLSSLPLLSGCIRFAETEMHLSAKRGIFSTQALWTAAEEISGDFLRFSAAEAVSVSRFIFGRLFAIRRESRKPLLARWKASKRPIWPAGESCRPGPMSVALPPARSGPTDRIGAASDGSLTDVGVGPAPAWETCRPGPTRRRETRGEPDRSDRRPGRRPAPKREPPVRPELLHADPAQWAQQPSKPRDAG